MTGVKLKETPTLTIPNKSSYKLSTLTINQMDQLKNKQMLIYFRLDTEKIREEHLSWRRWHAGSLKQLIKAKNSRQTNRNGS